MTHELMQFFVFDRLKTGELKAASEPFGIVARAVDACDGHICSLEIAEHVETLLRSVADLPDNCERDECVRELRIIPGLVRGLGDAMGGMSKGNALRRLMRAKDCAVRAVLYKTPEG